MEHDDYVMRRTGDSIRKNRPEFDETADIRPVIGNRDIETRDTVTGGKMHVASGKHCEEQ